MRTLMMLSIIAILTTTMAKSDETIDTKVKNYIQTEWVKIKEYQKTSWQNGKEQTVNNLNRIKSFFTKLSTN